MRERSQARQESPAARLEGGTAQSSRVAILTAGHVARRKRKPLIEERTMVEEAISRRELAARARARQEPAPSEQSELEISRWLVALVALGSVGVLVVFWGLAAWGLYTLFV